MSGRRQEDVPYNHRDIMRGLRDRARAKAIKPAESLAEPPSGEFDHVKVDEGVIQLRKDVLESVGELFGEPTIISITFTDVPNWQWRLPELAQTFPQLQSHALEEVKFELDRNVYDPTPQDGVLNKDTSKPALTITMDFDRDEYTSDFDFFFYNNGLSSLRSEIEEKPHMFIGRVDIKQNPISEIVRLKLLKELVTFASDQRTNNEPILSE